MMNENVIEIQELTKKYGSQSAVDGLTFAVPRGSVFGFLGVNGAGKTTTIRAIVGHLHPTSGEARTFGVDPWQMDERLRRRVAYVSENMALPGWMSPQQAARFCAAQTPNWNSRLAEKVIADFQLERDKPYRALSKGQRRRVCLLTALCAGADLLVLDEPASGLDVEARRQFLDQVLEIACDGGRTVFLSSHILTDLERVVDRVAMIDAGRLCLDGDLETLKASVRRLELPGCVEREAIASFFNVLRHEVGDAGTLAVVRDFSPEKLQALRGESGLAGEIGNIGFNLEDMFLEIRRSVGSAVPNGAADRPEGGSESCGN